MTKHLGDRSSFFNNLAGIGYVPFEEISQADLTELDAHEVEDILRPLGYDHISLWARASLENFRHVLDDMIDEGWHLGAFTYALVWDTRHPGEPMEGVPSMMWAFKELSPATRLSLNFDSRTIAE